MPRSRTSGPYRVAGDDRRWPTVGAAISVACNRASRATDEIQMAVWREDVKVARVVRHADRTISVIEVAE